MVHAYLSGPIIHSDLRKDDFYQMVVDVLEKKGITVFAPQFLSQASPEVIYERDVEQLKMSDLIIAEVSYPSHGVGMEIMLGIELEKPLILFRQTKAKPLSFMVKGAPGTVILEYDDLKEVRDTLQNQLQHTETKHQTEVDELRFTTDSIEQDYFILIDGLGYYWNSYYTLTDNFKIIPTSSQQKSAIEIELDKRYYKLIDDFEARFPQGVPALQNCKNLKVHGDVIFEKNIQLKGKVEIINRSKNQFIIPAGTLIEGRYII